MTYEELKEKIENGDVQKEFYSPSSSMEWCDEEGIYYNSSGQQLRSLQEYLPDEDGCYEPFGDE